MAQAKQKTPSPSQDMAELSEQIEILKKDIASLSGALSSLAGSTRDAALNGARDKAAKLRAVGEDQMDAIRRNAADLEHKATTAVREKPAAAVGLAVAAGFLLGFLTGRK